MADIVDRLGLHWPILQAGLGGGLATADLAGAVSRAGGLGTIGILSPRRIVRELAKAKAIAPNRPVAVNLLLPFTRTAPEDVRAALKAGAAGVACGTRFLLTTDRL